MDGNAIYHGMGGGQTSRMDFSVWGLLVFRAIKISRCFKMLSRQSYTQVWSSVIRVGNINL